MVPFDTRSPFVTSGMRVGTPAVTTRGLVESDMEQLVAWMMRLSSTTMKMLRLKRLVQLLWLT